MRFGRRTQDTAAAAGGGAAAGGSAPHDDPHRAVVRFRGRSVTFAIDNPHDAIQSALGRGRFYESRLLAAHADLIYKDSTVLDIGANVGNHTVYYALAREGRVTVYPFEPNPRAHDLLRTTVELNDLSSVIDLSLVHYGLGSATDELFVHSPAANNLGLTTLRPTGDVAVPVARLDDLSVTGPVSFIKIDVEGMELDVLAGAEELIAEHRPSLGIEVDSEQIQQFWSWADDHDYHVMGAARPYPGNVNYVCVSRR